MEQIPHQELNKLLIDFLDASDDAKRKLIAKQAEPFFVEAFIDHRPDVWGFSTLDDLVLKCFPIGKDRDPFVALSDMGKLMPERMCQVAAQWLKRHEPLPLTFAGQPEPEPDYVWPTFLPAAPGFATLLSGSQGLGKSMVLVELARQIAVGEGPMVDESTNRDIIDRGVTLWIGGWEDTRGQLIQRMTGLGPFDAERLVHFDGSRWDSNDDWVDQIASMARYSGATLIVIDNRDRLMEQFGLDYNKPSDMGDFLLRFKRLERDVTPSLLVVICHHRKGATTATDAIAGSSRFANHFGSALVVTRSGDDYGTSIIGQRKNRFGARSEIGYRFSIRKKSHPEYPKTGVPELVFGWDEPIPNHDPDAAIRDEAQRGVVDGRKRSRDSNRSLLTSKWGHDPDGFGRQQGIDYLGGNSKTSTFDRLVADLVREGELERIGQGKTTRWVFTEAKRVAG